MRKLILLFGISLVLVLAACGNDETSANEEENQVEESGEQMQNEPVEDNQNEENQESEENEASESADLLADVLNHFESNGFTVGEKTLKAFEMVGAVDGFGIELDGENVEFYLYESDSEDLEEMKTTGQYNMDGFVINAQVNGNVALMGYEEHPEADKIVEVFNSF
jgi:peptide subunit release factor RF-3